MSYDELNEVRFLKFVIKNKTRKYESVTLYHVMRNDALNEFILNRFEICFVLKNIIRLHFHKTVQP